MNNNVIISIKGVQTYDDADKQEIELVTEGTLSRNGEGYRLVYEEGPISGMDRTLTTFDIAANSVTLIRTGDVSSEMVFEQGKKHYSLYSTEFGAFTIGIASALVEHNLTDEGGDIAIDYSVEVDHALTGSNSFRINIRNSENNLKS